MIVLLILAGVALASLFGENGILNNAETAKNQTNLANSKEQVSLAITSAMTYQDSLGVVTKSNLVTELNQLIGENNYEITGEKAGPWTVKVIPTGDETITNATGSTVEIKKVTEIIIAETTLKLKVGGSKGLTVTTVQKV